jgi:hypothetical protein
LIFAQALKPYSGVSWESPVALLIKRMTFVSTFGDAYLTSVGAYSIKLNFWYYVAFQEEVVLRTLMCVPSDDNGRLISTNVPEFVIVVINYYSALIVITTQYLTDDPHQILLNAVGNT